MGRARSVPSKNIPLAGLALSVSFAALASGGPARASQLVDRNTSNVHLQVNAKCQALITYRASGRYRRVVGWGAINARQSATVGHQGRLREGLAARELVRDDPSVGGYVTPRSWPGHHRRGAGAGKRYRLMAPGPGVTPDISWEGPGLHGYNPRNPDDVAYEQAGNAILDCYRDRLCRQH
jgi:hypothetical protein